jgi:large subunit ribosomal protein L21
MLAIIETGGRQYPVSPGEGVRIEKLPGEVGSPVEFTKVVAVTQDDGKLLTGNDTKSAKVTGTIAAHGRGKKVIVFKFKKRKHYRRHIGHRQGYTEVQVNEIVL